MLFNPEHVEHKTIGLLTSCDNEQNQVWVPL